MDGRDDSETIDRDSGDDLDNLAQLDSAETLDGDGDQLDEGYSPTERPWAVDGRSGEHEDLDHRLARELPDLTDDDEGDGIGDSSDTDGEAWDDQVGTQRAGRLVAPDAGGTFDEEADEFADDIGIDGAGASAEEAAVHVVDDRP